MDTIDHAECFQCGLLLFKADDVTDKDFLEQVEQHVSSHLPEVFGETKKPQRKVVN